jgi:hypothetical protein
MASYAQIYRCETANGPVFSDQKCDDNAEIVTLGDQSQGLGGGPSEDVRDYLDQKRRERAEQREKSAQLRPAQARPATTPSSAPTENADLLPGYVRPIRPVRPIVRPRPRPEQPRPPDNGGEKPGDGVSVIRPNSSRRD